MLFSRFLSSVSLALSSRAFLVSSSPLLLSRVFFPPFFPPDLVSGPDVFARCAARARCRTGRVLRRQPAPRCL
eukprot:2397083-Rhodomonas_salina.1